MLTCFPGGRFPPAPAKGNAVNLITVVYMDGAEETFPARSGFKVEDGALEIHDNDTVTNVPLIGVRKFVARRG